VKRLLTILLTPALSLGLSLALAGPTLAQPDRERPSEEQRQEIRERMQERRDQNRDGERPRGPRDGDDDRRGEVRTIPPEDLDVALDILAEFRADTAQELRELAKDNPEAAAARLARSFPRIHEFIQMKQREPERFDLHLRSMRVMRETWQLKKQIFEARRDGNAEAIDELSGKLREQVAEMFDIRLALRRLEVEELRAKLQEVEAELEDAEQNREAYIDEKLEEELDPSRDRHRRGDRERGRDGDDDRERE
jgi:hypothetical protein